MDGELVHETDYCTQLAQNCWPDLRVICPTPFVIVQLFVYSASLGLQTHDFAELEMLNPGGQV